MRKLIVPGVVALTLAGGATAQAFFTPHFSVIAKQMETHRTHAGGFVFKDNLLDPANPSNSVGRNRVRCTPRSHDVLHCRGIVFLNGELGGEGTITAKGNLSEDEAIRFNVTGGSGDFNGVAGKVVSTDYNGRADLLEFSLVK